MLLKVGVAAILFSLLAVGVAAAAVVVGGGDEAERVTPVVAPVSYVGPPDSKEPPARKFVPGEKLEIADEPAPEREEPAQEPTPREAPREEPRTEPVPREEPREEPRPKPRPVPDLPKPTNEERASAKRPRSFAPDPASGMALTINAIGLRGVPVISSGGPEALTNGVAHVSETSLPWDEGEQRNVYVAGHYLGYPGTASRLVFYNLDKLQEGDEVSLTDGAGNDYRYRVSESFVASPEESWVMGQEVGRDMLTLQTCIPPDFGQRLVVRADRI